MFSGALLSKQNMFVCVWEGQRSEVLMARDLSLNQVLVLISMVKRMRRHRDSGPQP